MAKAFATRREAARRSCRRIVCVGIGPHQVDQHAADAGGFQPRRHGGIDQGRVGAQQDHRLPGAMGNQVDDAGLEERFASFNIDLDDAVGDQLIGEVAPLGNAMFLRLRLMVAVGVAVPAVERAGLGDAETDLRRTFQTTVGHAAFYFAGDG